MLEFAMRTEFVHPLCPPDAKRSDLAMMERQTRALEAIAAQLQTMPPERAEVLLDLQPQYLLAKRRLLEEAI